MATSVAEPAIVLVVDDDSTNRKLLGGLVAWMGYRPILASSGVEALDSIARTPPDAVLLDLMMPGMNGNEVISALRDQGLVPGLPVLIITASRERDHRIQALELGAFDYLTKPIDRHEVEARLRTAIELAKLRQALRQRGDRATREANELGRRLGVVLDELPLVLWEATVEDGTFVNRWVSENAGRVLGVPAGALIGADAWFEHAHQDDVWRLRVDSGLADGELRSGPWVTQIRWCPPEGEPIRLQLGASSVGDGESGRRLVGFSLDVTAAKKLEEAIVEAQKLEALGRMTGGIAHDFNNMLAVILSYGSFVRDALPEGDRRRADMGELLRAAERGAGLTRQLLTYSQARSHTEKRPVDLNRTLSELAEVIRRTVGERITVDIRESPRPAVVRGDPSLLDQAILNLSIQARDALPQGGQVSFEVSLPSQSAGRLAAGRVIRLVVRYRGTEIDQTPVSQLFEPIFASAEAGQVGSLGLAATYAIVGDVGGTIQRDDDPGRATAFVVEFPICDEAMDGQLTSPLESVQRSGVRVLIAEDEPALCRLAVRVLQSIGCDVTAALNGSEAIRILDESEQPFDIVFSDVVMPGAGGYTVAAHVADLHPHTRVLLTSGYLSHTGAQGVEDDWPILWKPYSSATLLRAVGEALDAPERPCDQVASRCDEEWALPPPLNREPTGARGDRGADEILLVCADPTRLAQRRNNLELAAFSIQCVASGEEALERLQEPGFCALVADVSLGGMDGLALLRASRAMQPELPVLLMTRSPSVEAATLAYRGGAAGYLTEPIDPVEFVREVERAVDEGELARVQRKLLTSVTDLSGVIEDLAATRKHFNEALETLHAVFQPIVRAHDRSVFAYEALLRTDHPDLHSPRRLLLAAEALDRSHELGRRVRRAIAQTLAEHPSRTESIFVNLEPSELRATILCSPGEPLLSFASRIVWEVTERASLSGGGDVLAEVAALRAAGYRVAIDDLGEGYAGLSWLVQVRPDVAKIDMSLVRNADQLRLKREIIASLVRVCRRNGIVVVAEGVETEAEAEVMADIGCDLLQGYLLGKPGGVFEVPT